MGPKTRFRELRVFDNNTVYAMPVQRTPLAPINSNRRLRQELTPWCRSEIQTYRNIGLTNEHISRLTSCTRSTVATTLRLNTLRNDGKTLPRAGRPPTLSVRDRRLILRVIRRTPKLTYAQLRVETGIDVSRSTLYRRLKDEGISNWLAKRGL